ncbi:hypothetical protein [Paenibacillus brevis]|uniref:Lipoprotein n=1 Tax=Paenibacillus brevis TaxID=2841508 RepID=A0ABS6FK54_9BACL|nr:hypothetical protein [Paenibacillus brevis]MBU5670550.1 hypothetical protein [Paenibacillus brevis]
MRRFAISMAVLMLVFLLGCTQESNPSTQETPSNKEISVETPEPATDTNSLEGLANQQFSIQGEQISEADYESIESFGKAFVDLYTGAVAEQETVSFDNYIANENLLHFTNKMLELEQRQELKGGIGVIFGLNNEFQQAEIEKLGNNLYRLNLAFSNQGSGMSCQLLVQADQKSLKISDLYFGNKDGVDTTVTGHPAVRKLEHPELWNDQVWVDSVMKKLEEYDLSSS